MKRCLVYILFLLLIAQPVFALEKGMCADAFVTGIEPVSVGPDEDFTVGIAVENCGLDLVKNITFEITRFSQEISIKEPLVQTIDSIEYNNLKRFFVYHMHTSPNIKPGEYHFETNLIYGKDVPISKTDGFNVTVKSDEPELAVSGVKTGPERIFPNQDVILTAKVENSGKGAAKDVKVTADGINFEGVKESYIGKIEPDEELPARFVLKSGQPGEYDFNMTVTYRFANEEKQEVFPIKIYVFSEGKNYTWEIVAGIFVLLVVSFFFINRKFNKEYKDLENLGLEKKRK